MSIKLLIADDDCLIREGLKIILENEPNFEIVRCVENGHEAVEECSRSEIDIVLMDIRMPIMNGVQATRAICNDTQTKVVILTTFDDDEFIVDAVKYGARGYLLKSSTPEKIKDTIKMVYNGGTVMQDIIMDKIKDELCADKKGKIDNTMFSKREFEIMQLIAKGMSNREIAGKIFISEGTIKNYITSILNKTGLEHRTQIAIYYLNGGKI